MIIAVIMSQCESQLSSLSVLEISHNCIYVELCRSSIKHV